MTYTIQRSADGGATWAHLAEVTDVTEYTDGLGLQGERTYTYRVRANGPWGVSAFSEPASATTPSAIPPTPVASATALTPTSVKVSWV